RSLDHGEQQRSFQHGKCRADTDSWAPAEGEKGKARNFAGADGVFAPALGIECIWIGEKARVAMRQGLKDEIVCAFSHSIATDFAVRYRFPTDAPDGGVKSHGFFEHHFRVAQTGKVL